MMLGDVSTLRHIDAPPGFPQCTALHKLAEPVSGNSHFREITRTENALLGDGTNLFGQCGFHAANIRYYSF